MRFRAKLQITAENEVRKDFTQSERVEISRAVEVELGERRGGDQKSNSKILLNDPDKGKQSSEIAAKKAGFGNKETYPVQVAGFYLPIIYFYRCTGVAPS